MPRQKEPLKLVMAKGKNHLTKDEIATREASEIQAPDDKVIAPKYLTKTQRDKFDEIAGQLKAIGIMSNLDVDTLARYIQSLDKYLKYNRMVNKILTATKDLDDMEGNADLLADYENLRDKSFKQCRTGASDLGLTITSRCRLVIPQAAPPPPENKFITKFGAG